MLEPCFIPFPEIKTNRLLLRQVRTSDAPAIMEMRSSEDVMQYIDRERTKSIEEAEAWARLVNDALDARTGITWAITFLDQPETLIGTIGFWRIIHSHYRAEVGYMLTPRHWKKGITKEALEGITRYGFGPMQLHSIEAHINPDNAASAALLESSGFIREAYFKEDYYFKGKFLDTAIYSLLSK